MGTLLIITLMVFVVGLFSTAAALLRGAWMAALGTLSVAILLGLLAGILRLWMRAATIAMQQVTMREDLDDLSLGNVLAKARRHETQEAQADIEHWLEDMAPKTRRKLLANKLDDLVLAREALRIATGIGLTAYVAHRAVHQGIVSLVHDALREQHESPHWAHAFEGDELTQQILQSEPAAEEDLADQLRHFIADTKPEYRVPVLAATLPEDLLAGSIVAYADAAQLLELLEQTNIN
jgi:hypothetical protein